MVNSFRGKTVAQGIRVAIVAGSFNELVTTQLVDGAEDALEQHSISDSEVDVYWVPGCFEIPQTVSWLLEKNEYDGIIALGCLIRGETDHYEFLATEVTRGLGNLAMMSDVAISYGILTCDNLEQALHRSGSKAGNKGADAMQALIQMINLSSAINDFDEDEGDLEGPEKDSENEAD